MRDEGWMRYCTYSPVLYGTVQYSTDEGWKGSASALSHYRRATRAGRFSADASQSEPIVDVVKSFGDREARAPEEHGRSNSG